MHPIRFYKVLSFLAQFGGALCVGLYIPFLLHLKLERSDIFLVNTIYWLTIAATEIPTGALADGKSRGWSVRMGLGIWTFGTIIYATAILAERKWVIMAIAILAEVLEGIGSSFISGAKQAWISDALKKEKRADEQGEVMGSAARWGYLGLLSGGAISFFLVDLGFATAWIIRALGIFLALTVCMRYMNGEGELAKKITEMESFKNSWSALRNSRSLKWAAFGSITFGFVLPFNLTWVPHFTNGLGRLPTVAVWTAVVAGLIIGAALVEKRKSIRHNPKHSLPLALGLAGIGLSLLGLTEGFWLPLFLVAIHEVGRGLVDPLTDDFIYKRADSEFKATYGSLHSMVSRGGFAVILGIQWFAMKGYFPQATDKTLWWASGTVLATSALAMWLMRQRKTMKS